MSANVKVDCLNLQSYRLRAALDGGINFVSFNRSGL
jgi:hypothetical protein